MSERPAQDLLRHNARVNLPTFASEFIGRSHELRDAIDLLETNALVTLIGPGGMGKTRLATQIALEMERTFAHGIVFVSLAEIRTTDQFIAELARALKLEWKGEGDAAAWLAQHLHAQSLLLVLDNFEQLHDSVSVISTIGLRAPGVRCLVTSRERLGLAHEMTIELRGLPISNDPAHRWADASPAAVAPGELQAAERLFVQTARMVRPNVVFSPDDLQHIRHICAITGGMPLAIELAASWTNVLPVSFVAQQIEQNLDWLSTSIGLTHEPNRSIRAVLDYFWNLLSPHEQHQVQRLSVFHGGFERDMAQSVAGTSPFFLAALIGHAFLMRTASGRYLLHDLLLQYADEKLQADADEAHDAQMNHTRVMLALAEAAGPHLNQADARDWVSRLDAELSNIRAVLQRAVQSPANSVQTELALRMLTAMHEYWHQRGLLHEGVQWMTQLLDSGCAVSQQVEAHALIACGQMLELLGELAASITRLQAGLDLAQTLHDTHAISSAAGVLSLVAHRQGNYAKAHRMADLALDVAQAKGDTKSLQRALKFKALVLSATGEMAQSLDFDRRSLALAQMLRDQPAIASSLDSIGINLSRLGRYAEAIPFFMQSLAISEETGNADDICNSLLNLGVNHHHSGDLAAAERYYLRAFELQHNLGNQDFIALLNMNLGKLSMDRDADMKSAARHYRESLVMSLRIGALPTALFCLNGIAVIALKQGDWAGADGLMRTVLQHPASTQSALHTARSGLAELRQRVEAGEMACIDAAVGGATRDLDSAAQDAMRILDAVA